MHPRGRGHAGILARVTARAGSGVCRQYVHVLSATSPPSWRRSLSRLFLHLLAATWRGPGRAKEERGSPCRRSSPPRRPREGGDPAPLFLLFALGPLCEAAKVGWKRPRAPHAVRARTARIWRQGRSPAAKPQPTVANRRLHRRRVTEGAFLWLLSLCKQRK